MATKPPTSFSMGLSMTSKPSSELGVALLFLRKPPKISKEKHLGWLTGGVCQDYPDFIWLLLQSWVRSGALCKERWFYAKDSSLVRHTQDDLSIRGTRWCFFGLVLSRKPGDWNGHDGIFVLSWWGNWKTYPTNPEDERQFVNAQHCKTWQHCNT